MIKIGFIVLFLLVAILTYLIMKKGTITRLRENKIQKLNNKLVKEQEFFNEYGEIENNSLVYKLERLIQTSGIKNYLKNFDTLRLLLIVTGTFFGSLIISAMISENILLSLFIGLALAVAEILVLVGMSARNYNKIEDDTEMFVSLLANHSKGSTDLVTIFEGACPNLDGILRSLVSQFLVDVKETGNVDASIDKMRNSIDNKQLSTILINLKNTSHFRANYDEVLSQMTSQIAESLSAREERKNVLFSMKITLIVISIASLIIVKIIGSCLSIDVLEILTANMFGQGLLFVLGLVYLFVVTRLFKTDR